MKLIFYGNYFLALCAVVLSIESSVQQKLLLNESFYYVFIFLSTVVYYTHAYTSTQSKKNDRDIWYLKNRPIVRLTQWVFTTICLAFLSIFLIKNANALLQISFREYAFIGSIPLLAIFYYSIPIPLFLTNNLRKIGWLKPFLIGFIWSAVVTYFPVFYYKISHETPIQWTFLSNILFINNLMFAAILSTMFDIKDHADDANIALKTFIVRVGLRKTIYFILLPLCLAGFGCYIIFALYGHFSVGKILVLSMPYTILFFLIKSLQKKQSLWFYLTAVDGLLLFKAVCGIVAAYYF
jgi:4-hydroxybenzoate polyprenyltransferase